mmetsp:Transcript_34934/g.54941  ORF Transcript_34934/g.54941 Transcript_34934/m.54941 type:complete len:348 (-) Transcript_34934:102-1145(-)
MIIQSICLLDQLDKDLNTFAMRVREWYCWHFPELRELVKDNYLFARCAAFIQDRTSLTEDKLPELTEIVMDEDLAKQIVHASKLSMGMECSPVDMLNISQFTSRMVALAEYRKQLFQYLQEKMATVAPNLATLIGETVAARLISKAGSLTSLAKCPASTVQILGAEKALFRALKTKGNTPKYGLIYHASLIGQTSNKNKGKISRVLAAKTALAIRVDALGEDDDTTVGLEARAKVEGRIRALDGGARLSLSGAGKVDTPLKKYDSKAAKAEATPGYNEDEDVTLKSEKKKKKKRKAEEAVDDEEEAPTTEKKKKKKKKKESADDGEEPPTTEKKKKKKKKKAVEDDA